MVRHISAIRIAGSSQASDRKTRAAAAKTASAETFLATRSPNTA